ncbi:MAG TPA: GNAT family N-acetyltransferase [Xanthobacteraceae bacterium]|nr:GNAT family N-acetyltransferase [Xanthobacteraceae bacterium]
MIFDAKPGDAAALAALHGRSFAHGWSESEFERLLSDRAVIAHVARASGRGTPVGFLLSRCAADEAEILTVAVAPAARGQGIAGQLLARHLGRLAALGTARIFLEVKETNRPARRLYARAGFREVGRREGYYARREGSGSALTLQRDLV